MTSMWNQIILFVYGTSALQHLLGGEKLEEIKDDEEKKNLIL